MATPSKWLKFDCFILKQTEGPEIAVLAIDAYRLREIATVSRIADERTGYQRFLNNRKVAAIKRYVETPNAVLPTSIVLATGETGGMVKVVNRKLLDSSGQICSAQLLVKQGSNYKPLLVIDGQHRLFGITLSSVVPYPVPVTILIGASKLVQMAHFEIINNKATRIATSHLNELRALMYDLSPKDKEDLDSLLSQLGVTSLSSAGLVSELNGDGMVFEGILDFPSNKKAGFVSSNTLVHAVEKSRERGFLAYIEEDDNDHLTAYNSMWQGIKNKFSRRWKLETDLFKNFANEKQKKSEARASLKLLHSGSLAVLGEIADKELASSSYRSKWLTKPQQMGELVQKEIFANLPENFWDDANLQVDNTGKGRAALRNTIEKQMVTSSVTADRQ
jgi:DNA sulfur modification protein DndB